MVTEVIHVLVRCAQLKELLLLPKVCVKTQEPQVVTEHNLMNRCPKFLVGHPVQNHALCEIFKQISQLIPGVAVCIQTGASKGQHQDFFSAQQGQKLFGIVDDRPEGLLPPSASFYYPATRPLRTTWPRQRQGHRKDEELAPLGRKGTKSRRERGERSRGCRMTQKQRMDKNKIFVSDLNPYITCRLCEGYFIDATTLVDCLHVFCRACILRHFENSKTGCPTCNTVCKKKSQAYFRPDPQVQSLVYKLVPSLYAKEMQRREDFYRSTGVRASSSCSDDSVIDRERDMINDQEEMISSHVGDKTQFLSPDDSISLSLEYYQAYLDREDQRPPCVAHKDVLQHPEFGHNDTTDSLPKTSDGDQTKKSDSGDLTADSSDSECAKGKEGARKNNGNLVEGDKESSATEKNETKDCDKRFLQCPAAVSMKHLQKFVRMKFGLTGDHRVDVIYKGEVLPANFSLMDVAYTFKWKRSSPT
ncbi:hypothetical protein NQ318_015005 [Aromia moschata]|uniref:RING-type domain-containing protein n=1 Tax=Aromia moschata TaxID=1265417 RepID=A0AAV8YX35_9CUCU|nr:hypothetical protein NQ318_015005 [Aromia moschata]